MSGWDGWTLALDAATYEGSVAVLRDGRVVAQRVAAMRGETEERLMPALVGALEEAGTSVREVARVVCGEGPGSFTSLRIAASIAKGIALGNGVPLYAVSSLALIVASDAKRSPGRYLAVLDAMRGERYVMPFVVGPGGTIVSPDTPEQERRLAVRTVLPAGDVTALAARGSAITLGPLEPSPAVPHARGVAALLDTIGRDGPVDLDSWEPIYGRLAEAQVKWEAAHQRPLPT